MIKNYLPEVMDEDELQVIESLIESLRFLKGEAGREGQAFIAYAIEDVILQAKAVRRSKFTPQAYHNMQ